MTLDSLYNTIKQWILGIYHTEFYYSVVAVDGKELKGFEKISDHPVTCFGFIGDLISYVRYKKAECCGWIDDDVKLLIQNNDFIKHVNYFIYSFREKNNDTNKKIVELLSNVNKNWGMDIEYENVNGIIHLWVHKNSFLKSKWKFQSVMRLIRLFYSQEIFYKRNNTLIRFNQTTYYYDGYYSTNISQYSDSHKNALLLTMSEIEIDDSTSFILNNDRIYSPNKMTETSQTIGIMSLIYHIAQTHGIISKNQKPASIA